MEIQSGSLTIVSLSPATCGHYQCVASSSVGAVLSQPATVSMGSKFICISVLCSLPIPSLTFRKHLDENVLGWFFSLSQYVDYDGLYTSCLFLILSSETCQVMQPWNRFPRKLVDPHPWRLLKPQLDQTIPDGFSVGVSLISS